MTTAPQGPGGYRAPSNPAPVSGPGALSQLLTGDRHNLLSTSQECHMDKDKKPTQIK